MKNHAWLHVTHAAATSRLPHADRPLFVSFEIYFHILPFLPIFRFHHSSYTFFLRHTLPPLVSINPCSCRTLQFKFTTVPHSQVACCAYNSSHTEALYSLLLSSSLLEESDFFSARNELSSNVTWADSTIRQVSSSSTLYTSLSLTPRNFLA